MRIAGLETRIKNFHTEIEDLKAAVSAKKVEIQNAQTLIEKYTKQQDNVRNNREFDFLSKEIEYQTLEIQLCEKRINEFIAAQEAKSNQDLQSHLQGLELQEEAHPSMFLFYRFPKEWFVTGEIRYHDYFEFESHILLAEIGHYESEQYTKEKSNAGSSYGWLLFSASITASCTCIGTITSKRVSCSR